MKQDEEPAQAPRRDHTPSQIIIEICPRVQRAGEPDEGHDEQDEGGKRINIHQSPERDLGSVSQHLLDEGNLGHDQAGHRGEIHSMQHTGMGSRKTEHGSQQRCGEKNNHRLDNRIHRGISTSTLKIFTIDISNVSSAGGT